MSVESDFLASHQDLAASCAGRLGIGTDVVLAQWALETGWGTSPLAQQDNNLAGIKALFPPPEYLHFADLTAFGEQYVRTVKADCPVVRSGKLTTSSEPVEVFAGSDYATPQYGRQVQAVWQTIQDMRSAPPAETPSTPAEPTPEPGHDVAPAEPAEISVPDSEGTGDQDAPSTEPVGNPKTTIITLPAVAGLGGLAEDQWSVEVELSNPDGSKTWTGTAQLDSGSQETLLPGVPNGIADVLGLSHDATETVMGVTGSSQVFDSTVTVAFVDPTTGSKLILSDSKCLIDPSADLLLIGAKAFIDRGITIELDPVAKTVAFVTGG